MIDVGSNVQGFKELEAKLMKLETATAAKALRAAGMAATLPTVKEMKAAAPKGTRMHKTYKKRLVAPGFLSRSVARKGRIDKRTGRAVITLGVKEEAFYGVAFLDDGVTVTKRLQSQSGKRKRNHISVKPYRIKAHRWFKSRFIKNSSKIVGLFKQKLAEKIAKAAQ